MSEELNKFLTVYNTLVPEEDQVIFSQLEKQFGYAKIVRLIGFYIFTEYDEKTWIDSVILFSQSGNINFSVFKNTKYFHSVENYLNSLKNVFFQNDVEEVRKYFENCSFTSEQKEICKKYFTALNNFQTSLNKNLFSNLSFDPSSKKDMELYMKKELYELHNIIDRCAGNSEYMNVLELFLNDLKIISNSIQKNTVFFNDLKD
jgi:hypothetical protein